MSIVAFAADPEYFPLAVGNSWVYKTTEGRLADVQAVDVAGTASFEGRDYFLVHFFQRDVYLRVSTDGTLFEYDQNAKKEKVWIAFGTDAGQSFPTEIDNCDKTAKVESKAAKYSGPTGTFTNALQLSFVKSCTDAGIISETFLPYVGLVEHVVDNIAGARKYSLIYSRTGVTEVTTPEIRFSLSLDAAVYPVSSAASQLVARLTLRNTTASPVTLQFPSGQTYELKIRNEKGEMVYQWSQGMAFTQIFRTENFGPGERNYPILVQLPSLPAGKYVADANLTTVDPTIYTASVGFEVRANP